MADDNTVHNSCGNLNITISDVLLQKIINHLSPKSVVRCKFVSKHWNSIISEPNFIPFYISRNAIPSWFIFERTLDISSNGRQFPIELILRKPLNLSTLSIDFHELGPYSILDHTTLMNCSDGLLLVGSEVSDIPQLSRGAGCRLFVINAITNEWVALPIPPFFIFDNLSLGFITQIDRNTRVFKKFIVVDYQPSANKLMYFSSEKAEWEWISTTNYMLEGHIWGFSGGGNFEFDGKLIWYDLSVGLMIWDNPLSSVENIVELRLIWLPLEHVRLGQHIRLEGERRIDNGGGHIQYVHVDKLSNIVKLWRLDKLWNCLYSLDLRQLYPQFGQVRPVLIHPFEDLVAIFKMDKTIFCLDFKTAELKSSAPIVPHIEMHFVSVLLPSWPTSFTPNMHARFLKEEGNQCFMERRYDEAIYLYTKSIEYIENIEVYMLRGKTYNRLHKIHEAYKDFLKVIQIDSYFYRTYRIQEAINNEILF
ncbi:unnamed protein product [Amaranthus hypochondriacus]